MKVIGLGHRTQKLDGCNLIMMESGSMQVTGKAVNVGVNITTTGTETTTGTITRAIKSTMIRTTTTSNIRPAACLRRSRIGKKLEATETPSPQTLVS
jgi:hypothetical protein